MLNKYRKFRGGYKFKAPEGIFGLKIDNLPLPTKVILPLQLRFGSRIAPLVKKGDQVQAGQIIARDDETISAPAIASVSGIVEDILPIDYYYGKVEAIAIKPNGDEDFVPLPGATPDFEGLGFEKVSELIYLSGAASLGKSGIPTVLKSSPARPQSIETIIITTFGTGPFALGSERIFRSREEDFYKGLAILKQALPKAKVIIAVDEKDKEFLKKIVDAIRRGSLTTRSPDWLFIQPLEKKYPQESEAMLTRTVLGKNIPIGGLGVDVGTLILDIRDVLHVYEAVALGKPLIESTVALAGSACKENKYLNLRIGTSLAEVLEGRVIEGRPFRAIFGGAMAGITERDLTIPVGRSIGRITVLWENTKREFMAFMHPGLKKDSYSKAFLSSWLPSFIKYDANLKGELRACIQCGYCDEVCPVGIIPHLLSKQIKHDVCEGTERLGIFECIDCGLCSYVCPSKISLAEDIASGKRKLIEEGCSVPQIKVKESEEAVKAYRGRMPL